MAGERFAEGRRILVVEDEMTIVVLIEDALLELGAEVVGPTAHLDVALKLAGEERIDAALLDINIRGGSSYAVADVLTQRGIPFMFSTGYGEWALEERHRERPRLTKPFAAEELAVRVLEMLRARPG